MYLGYTAEWYLHAFKTDQFTDKQHETITIQNKHTQFNSNALCAIIIGECSIGIVMKVNGGVECYDATLIEYVCCGEM